MPSKKHIKVFAKTKLQAKHILKKVEKYQFSSKSVALLDVPGDAKIDLLLLTWKTYEELVRNVPKDIGLSRWCILDEESNDRIELHIIYPSKNIPANALIWSVHVALSIIRKTGRIHTDDQIAELVLNIYEQITKALSSFDNYRKANLNKSRPSDTTKVKRLYNE